LLGLRLVQKDFDRALACIRVSLDAPEQECYNPRRIPREEPVEV
jgi:hypothetical protein